MEDLLILCAFFSFLIAVVFLILKTSLQYKVLKKTNISLIKKIVILNIPFIFIPYKETQLNKRGSIYAFCVLVFSIIFYIIIFNI